MTLLTSGPAGPRHPPPEWPAHPPEAPPTASSPGDPPPDAPRRAGGADDRTALAVVLAVVAAVLLALGNAAAWVADTGTDRDTYADARLLELEDGGLSRLVRDRVTEVVLAWVDVPERTEAALPGPLGLLGGPAEDLAGLAVGEAVDVALAQPEVEAVLARLEEAADDELARLLFDEAEWLRLDGDVVVLDLDPVVAVVLERLDELIPGWASETVPSFDAGDVVPDAIDGGGLELAIGRVDVLLEARDALDGLEGLARRYVLPGAALGVAALLLARRRRPAFLAFGATLALVAVLVGTPAGVGAMFGGDIGPLDEVAGQSFTSLDGGLGHRTTLAVSAGLAVVAAAALSTRLPGGLARRAAGAGGATSGR